MHYDPRDWPPKLTMPVVQWLKENFDFVAEVEVPLMTIRFALESEEKKRRQIEAIEGLFDSMLKENPAPLDIKGIDLNVMAKGAERLKNIMDSTSPGEISTSKKYAMALQIQRWIHDAGGLC